MKSEEIYERSQAADRMEAVMLIASAVGVIAAAVVLFAYGWLASLALFLLSAITFALSRVFDLLGDLLAAVGRLDQSKKPGRSEKGEHAN